MRGFFSGIVRGMSNAHEGSKILTFLFRPRLVCISSTSPKLVEEKFSELAPSGLPLRPSNRMGQGYNQVGDLA